MPGQLNSATPSWQDPAPGRRYWAPHWSVPEPPNASWDQPCARWSEAWRPEGSQRAGREISLSSTHATSSTSQWADLSLSSTRATSSTSQGADPEISLGSARASSSTNPCPDRSTRDGEDFEGAIMACARQGNISKAEELFRRIENRNIGLSVDTYNAIIQACTQNGEIGRVEGYVHRMTERGFKPNLMTYNIVINACAGLGDAHGAGTWMKSMVQQGVRPNIVTYGTICKALARQGNIEQIEHIMGLIEENNIPLNEYFYASLISACRTANPPDPARAERVLEELCRRGLRPQKVKRAFARVVGTGRMAQIFETFGRTQGLSSSGEEFCVPSRNTGTTRGHAEVNDGESRSRQRRLQVQRLSARQTGGGLSVEMCHPAVSSQTKTKAYVPGEVFRSAVAQQTPGSAMSDRRQTCSSQHGPLR